MHASPVVFCERTGNWAAAWRRLQARRDQAQAARPEAAHPEGASPDRGSLRLIETRSAAECRDVVAANRGSFVVVELEPARLEQTLDLLFDVGVRFAGPASAVVASRQLRQYEPLARELGAQAFVVSLLELERLRDLAGRHARRSNVGRANVETGEVRERIWTNLPWGRT